MMTPFLQLLHARIRKDLIGLNRTLMRGKCRIQILTAHLTPAVFLTRFIQLYIAICHRRLCSVEFYGNKILGRTFATGCH